MMGVSSGRAAEDDLTLRARMSKLAMTAFPADLDAPAGSLQLGNQFANFSRHRVKEESSRSVRFDSCRRESVLPAREIKEKRPGASMAALKPVCSGARC